MTFICDIIKKLLKKEPTSPSEEPSAPITPTIVYNPADNTSPLENIDKFYEANEATMLRHPNHIVLVEANTGRYSFHNGHEDANRYQALKRSQGYTKDFFMLALDHEAKMITAFEIDEFKLFDVKYHT